MKPAGRRAGAAALFGAVLICAPAFAGEPPIELHLSSGIVQTFFLTVPQGAPAASLILFTGGSGIVARTGENFLLRSREKFAARGFLVAAVDVPSNHQAGLNAVIRGSDEYARDIAPVIAELRRRAQVAVWLVGTSTGTISAASVAARLRQGGADGLVMTSSFVPVGGPAPPIPALIDPAAIRIPTLFVHNKEDACGTSRFANLAPLIARFSSAPRKELIAVEGGLPPQSDPCDALSRHGYYGIEDQVIDRIAAWIKRG
ncbi:MAG TPA: alpha/beta hydrolase [Stellaceae bacterium]|nr:alpha/beta hydrolase [Stellaceae bacterium]